MPGKHHHAEAFMLMTYASEDGSESEVLWNSRDGVTPFIIASAHTGVELAHRNWKADRYAPDHTPKVGDRIFVDLTEQRARVFAAMQIEEMYSDPEYRSMLEEEYASREEAVAERAKSMLAQAGAPDILVVTDGFLHTLEERRAQEPVKVIYTGFDLGIESTTQSSTVTKAPTLGGRTIYFDRQGQPISMERYEALFFMTEDYKRLALDILEGTIEEAMYDQAKQSAFVSTIWLGLDHGFGGLTGPKPLIFETQAWRGGHLRQQRRYATEEEAINGHTEITGLMRAVIEAERYAYEQQKKGDN